jgi:hypothetical protein
MECYSEQGITDMLDDDEVSLAEAGFLQGYVEAMNDS